MTQRPASSDHSQKVGTLMRDLDVPLKRYFARNGFNGIDSEDLVQEVFLKLSKMDSTATIENTQAYTFKIAANVIRDRRRALDARVKFSDAPISEHNEPAEHSDPERSLIARQSLDRVQHALMSLPSRTRTVFLLHRFDGLRYREIAKVLGVSVSSVEKHMMLAMSHVLAASKTL